MANRKTTKINIKMAKERLEKTIILDNKSTSFTSRLTEYFSDLVVVPTIRNRQLYFNQQQQKGG